ncbi:MAG TPA: hypothetical protein VF668_15765 [Pyrinomonadaceae bacterium]|jgi:hypothetical protein
MPTWMKVLLAAGVLLALLIVGAVVAGYFVVSRYGPGLMEAGRQTLTEGAEYGRRTDNEGCLNEAAARHARVNGFADTVRNGVFMEACLRESRPTPGFCDGVPRQTDFLKGVTWQHQQCKRFGLKPEQQCGQLFQGVQRFCESRPAGGGAVEGAGDDAGDDAGQGEPPPAPPPPASSR